MSTGYGSIPGIGAIRTNDEKALVWGQYERLHLANEGALIVSTAVDAGSTPTTHLRAGLLMGKITSSGKLKQWDPDATDGSEVVYGVLWREVFMLDPVTQVVVDRIGHVLLTGPVRAADLLILGTAFNSADGENIARAQMAPRFWIDDDIAKKQAFLGLPLKETAKAASYTVVEADNGTLFTTLGASGAVTFTLPAIRPGLAFEFLNLVDQNMIIASAEGDNLVALHAASADSVAGQTTSQKIGVRFMVHANQAGTKWYVRNLSPAGATITVAT